MSTSQRIARTSLKDMPQKKPNTVGVGGGGGGGVSKSKKRKIAKKSKLELAKRPIESLLAYSSTENLVSRNRDRGGGDIYQGSGFYKGQDGERIARRRSLSPPPRRDTRTNYDDDRHDRNGREDPRMWPQQQTDNFDNLNNMQIIEQQPQNPMLIQMPLSALNMGSSLNPNQTYILYQDQAAALSALGGNQANVQFIPVTANMLGGGGGNSGGLQSIDNSPPTNYRPSTSQRDLAGKSYDSIQDSRVDYHPQKSNIVDQRKPVVIRYDGVNAVGEDAIIRVPYCRVCNEYIPRDKDLEIHLTSQQHFQNYYSGTSNVRDDDVIRSDRKLPSHTVTNSSSSTNKKDSYYISSSSSREILEEKRSTVGRQRDEDYYVGHTRRSSASRRRSRSRSPLPSSHNLVSSSRSSHNQQQHHYIEDERTRPSDSRDRGHAASSSTIIDRHSRSNRDPDPATWQRQESFSEYLRGRSLQSPPRTLQNISSVSRSHHQEVVVVDDHHRRDSRDRDNYRRDTTTELSDSRRYRDDGVEKIYRRHLSPIPTSASSLGTNRNLQPFVAASSPISRSRTLDPDISNKYPKFNAPKTLSKDFGKNRRKDFGQPFSTDDLRTDTQTYGKISQCTVCGLKGQFNLGQHMRIAHKIQ